MIYKASRLIVEEFDRNDIKYGGKIQEYDDSSLVEAGFRIDNGPFVIARFISRDDDNDVAVRVFAIISVNEEKRQQVLQEVNAVNCKVRHIKFLLDEDGDLNAEYDFPVNLADEQVGKVAVEMFARLMHILNDLYPDSMRAMWQ